MFPTFFFLFSNFYSLVLFILDGNWTRRTLEGIFKHQWTFDILIRWQVVEDGLRGSMICLSLFPLWMNWVNLHFLLCIVSLSLLIGLLRTGVPKSNDWLSPECPMKKNPYSHISTNRGEKQLVPVEEGRHENVPIIKLVHKSLGPFSLSCPSGKLSLNPIVYLSSYLWSTRPLLGLEWQPIPQQTWDSLETCCWERKCLGY